jgi:metal-responsive CopG/Arc/MetJ family transcriptional regulator
MESSDIAGLTEIGANSTNLAAVTSLDKQLPSITGNLMVTFKINNSKIEKRINKIEYQYRKLIKIRNNSYSPPNVTYNYVLEGSTFEFHSFVSNVNSIEEIDNVRYNILDEIEDAELGSEKV